MPSGVQVEPKIKVEDWTETLSNSIFESEVY